jgi:hypothetical protein
MNATVQRPVRAGEVRRPDNWWTIQEWNTPRRQSPVAKDTDRTGERPIARKGATQPSIDPPAIHRRSRSIRTQSVAAVAIERTSTHITHASAQARTAMHGRSCAWPGFGSSRSEVQIPAPRFGELLRWLILDRTLRELVTERFCCRKHIGSNRMSGGDCKRAQSRNGAILPIQLEGDDCRSGNSLPAIAAPAVVGPVVVEVEPPATFVRRSITPT